MVIRYYVEFDKYDGDTLQETIKSQVITRYEIDHMQEQDKKEEAMTALMCALQDKSINDDCDLFRIAYQTSIGSMELSFCIVRLKDTGTSYAFDADFLMEEAEDMMKRGIYVPIYERLNPAKN